MNDYATRSDRIPDAPQVRQDHTIAVFALGMCVGILLAGLPDWLPLLQDFIGR